MKDRDRLGVNIVGAGVLAYLSTSLGPISGAEVSAVLPYVLQEVTGRRVRNLEVVTEDAAHLRGLDGPALVEWVRASDTHAAFLTEALEVAWSTLDGHKLRSLSRVLADGMEDDARIDVDRLVVLALRDLEGGHLRVLTTIATTRPDEMDMWGTPAQNLAYFDRVANGSGMTWATADIAARHQPLADALHSIIATLQRLGCIASVSNPYGSPGQEGWTVVDFGLRCLEWCEGVGGGSPSWPARG